MMYPTKSFNSPILDITDDGMVKVAFSKTNFKDFDGDVIVPEAYSKTIQERGPKSSKSLIYHLTDHSWKWSTSFIAKPKELFLENEYLVGVSDIDLKTNPHGAFMHARYVRGEVTQHSIGFRTIKQQKKGDYNEITELQLLEGSAVLWGANIDTPTFEAKSITPESKESILSEIKALEDQMKRYLKTGLSTDDTYFMGMQISQLYMKAEKIATITKPSTDTLPSMEQIKAAFRESIIF